MFCFVFCWFNIVALPQKCEFLKRNKLITCNFSFKCTRSDGMQYGAIPSACSAIIARWSSSRHLAVPQAPRCASCRCLQALRCASRHFRRSYDSSVTQAQAVENSMQSMYICLSTNELKGLPVFHLLGLGAL